ncbi:MAG TPA: SLC13 family permease [Anaerolineales bacterium]|jgi:di/tricarboxylate transporter|nr:SLC13 family permease [Anaerolineales bacterium]
MVNGIETNQIFLFAILAGAALLLFTEWIRIDLTAILIIAALGLTGVLDAEGALSGFSSEPAIILASMFVLSGALLHTGLSERLGNRIKILAGKNYARIILVVMPSVALLSAFVGHVALTAIMLPIILNLARENQIAPSKLLIPMAFAASLGTAIALIGAPAFLVANGLLRQTGQAPIGIFSIAPIGLVISAAGTVFFLLVGRFLLPDRKGEDAVDHFRLEGYYTELLLLPDSTLISKTIREVEEQQPVDFKVSAWYRNGRPRNRPYGTKKTQAGDVLVIRTSPDRIATIEKEPGMAIQPLEKYKETFPAAANGENSKEDFSTRLVQSVVAPRSELIGRTIGKIDFLENYGVLVVGVWRRKGWLRTELSRVKLREGDVLVLTGDSDSLQRISEDKSFLMLVPFRGEPKPLHKARIAGTIMIAAVAIAALGIFPVEIVFLAGALAMILSGSISTSQAYQSIDARIYIFIAGAIPLGLAMQETGTADLLAGWLQGLVSGLEIHWILLALFVVTGIVTQVMSDSGTTALFGPIAIALARGLDLPPEPFVVTVAMAAVTSFFTPIGHHGNLLIYGPGGYQFGDFVKVGIPLTLIVAVIVSLMAPLLWPG